MSHVDGVDDGVGYGVYGASQTGTAVVGISDDHYGVVGVSSNSAGLYGKSVNDYAAILNGKVKITGNRQNVLTTNFYFP